MTHHKSIIFPHDKLLTNLPSVEHNVPPADPNLSNHPPRRPDLSTFFATFEHVDTSNTNNENALPIPAEVSAAFRSLAEAFGHMRQDGSGDLNSPLEGMIEALLSEADMPPKEVKGVSQGFLDGEFYDLWLLPLSPMPQSSPTFER